MTHLELHIQIHGTEEVDHPRHPSLFLGQFVPLVVRPSPGVLPTQGLAMVTSWTRAGIRLISYEDMT